MKKIKRDQFDYTKISNTCTARDAIKLQNMKNKNGVPITDKVVIWNM